MPILIAVAAEAAGRRERDTAAKRGGRRRVVPLDVAAAERRLAEAERAGQTPEKQFDRQWALTVLDLAMRRLERRYAGKGKRTLFDRLHVNLTGDEKTSSYRELAAELGMTEGAVKVAVHRMRQEYRQIVRDLIGQTLASAEEVDEEVRHLFAALSR